MIDYSAVLRLNLSKVQSNIADSLDKLSTGKRINHSKDDPAGYAISVSILHSISSDNAVISNLHSAAEFLNIRETVLNQIVEDLNSDNPDLSAVNKSLSVMSKDISVNLDKTGELIIPKITVDLSKPVAEIISAVQNQITAIGFIQKKVDSYISSVNSRIIINQQKYHRLVDVDPAAELAKLTKHQILQQVGFNMLNLYNQNLSNILLLLR
jgi:flagellin